MTRSRDPSSLVEWITQARALPKQDLDDVILFEGDEGVGKSTLAFQIARAIDPGFNVDRVYFDIEPFMEAAKRLPPGSFILADEILAGNRHAMWGENVAFLDFLQMCRAQNLHLGLCFPHAEILDKPILDLRVRYRVNVPSRGVAWLHSRKVYYAGDGERVTSWKPHFRWRFGPNAGPLWEAYKAIKSDRIRRAALPESEREEQETTREQQEAIAAIQWDRDALKKISSR